jgi:hypothetical protein
MKTYFFPLGLLRRALAKTPDNKEGRDYWALNHYLQIGSSPNFVNWQAIGVAVEALCQDMLGKGS